MSARLLALITLLAVEGEVRADDKAACIAAAETGQDLRAEGKLSAARERFLECASPACPPAVRADCERFLEEVGKNLPSIVISAVDTSGADVVDAHAFLDDVATPLDGKAVPVDPGKHVVRVAPKSGAELRTEIVVSEGEKNRKVQVVFPAKPAPPPTLEPARPSIAAYVVGAAGLALASGSVYLGVTARREISDLRSSCAPYCTASEVDPAKRRLLFADIGVGLGAVALGVATFMFVFPSRSEAPKTSTIGAVHIPSGAIVQWSSVF